MNIGRIFILFNLVFLTEFAFSGSLTAHLSSTQVEEGDEVILTLSVSGRFSGSPEIPEIDNVEVVGTGQSTNVTMVNGQFSKETTYSYTLIPEGKGTYRIPSISLEIDGKVEKSIPLSFKVSDVPNAKGASKSGSKIFVERSFSSLSPYVGQPIIETIEVYHKVNIEQASPIGKESPDFRYFQIEEQDHNKKQVGGEIYNVITVYKVLVPNSSGLKTIPPYKLNTVIVEPRSRSRGRSPFPDFFNTGKRIQKRVKSSSAEMEVKPLPPSPKKNHQSVVGSFKLKGGVNTHSLKVGETVTLTLEIYGNGSLDNLSELDLDFSGVKVYPDKPEGEQTVDPRVGLRSSKVFKYALVPTEEGGINLGQVKLVVFNPELGKYETLSISIDPIEVLPSEQNNAVVVTSDGSKTEVSKNRVKHINQDILDIHRDYNAKISDRLSSLDIYAGLMALLIPIMVLGVGVFRNKKPSEQSMKKSVRSKAYKNLLESCKSRSSSLSEVSLKEHYLGLSLDYKSYLGNRLGFQGSSMTSKELVETLGRKKIEETLICESENIVKDIESVAYSGKKVTEDVFKSQLIRIEELAKKVEKQC